MFNTGKKILTLLAALLFFICVGAGVYQDFNTADKAYKCDLRKRITGARYQAAGLSPYFYKWQPGQSEIFCDPYESGDSFKQNIVTMPPSYLWLIQPLAKLNFSHIERIWMGFQYLALLIIYMVFFIRSPQLFQRVLLTVFFSVFLFTNGWRFDLQIGQSYIVFPLLFTTALLFYNKKPGRFVMAGIILAIACWLRPLCILVTIPFIISGDRRLFFKGFIPAAVLCVLQILLFQQVNDWKDFFHSSLLWSEYYNSPASLSGGDFGNGNWPAVIEGQSNYHNTPLPAYTANLPLVLYALCRQFVPAGYFLAAFAGVAATMALLLRKNAVKLTWNLCWVAGFIFYYLAEIMLTIPKPSYYFTELIFPVALVLINSSKKDITILSLLAAGLLFAASPLKIIPMQLLLGEYLVVAAVMIYLYKSVIKRTVYQNHGNDA